MRVAHNTRSAELAHGQLLDFAGLCPRQHDAPLDHLAGVVVIASALSHIDQFGRDIGGFAIFRQRHGAGRIARDLVGPILRDVGKLPFLGIPSRSRPLGPIHDFSVRRDAQNLNVTQAIRARAFRNQFRSRVKSLRAALPVKARQTLQVALGGLAAQFVRECRDLRGREQRRRMRQSRGSRAYHQ